MSSEAASSFNALRQQWQARWNALAPRERQMALAAGWLVLLAMVILLGIRPAWRSLQQTPVQLREVNSQLERMRRLAEETTSLRNTAPVPPAQSEAAVQAATTRLGDKAQVRIQGDRATAEFKNISGRALAEWLAEVRASARARPLEANLTQTQTGIYVGTIVLGLVPGPASAQ